MHTRGATNPDLDALTPVERLAAALDAVTDQEHAVNYEDFVRARVLRHGERDSDIPGRLDAISRTWAPFGVTGLP